MRFEKLGCVFRAEGQRPWMASHAQVPVAERIEGSLYRVYFTTRDAQNRSHIAWLEVDLAQPSRILRLAERPLLGPGPAGAFDDAGAMTSWLVPHAGRRRFYYIGWNVRATVPFQNAVGLATCGTDTLPDSLERHAEGPILDRSVDDPYFCSNPCVLLEAGRWRMWYLSGRAWSPLRGKLEPRYDVRHAESGDGLRWRPTGGACIPLAPGELAIARPCVLREAGRYRMWYCYRGEDFPYRMGYAESADGLAWTRMDADAGIEASPAGWDSGMIAYPFVFDHDGRRYMLYCGNDYSKAGFGLAVHA